MKKDPETLAEFSGICKAIKEKFKYDHFSFKPFTENEVTNVILKLPKNKASLSNDISKPILKQFGYFYCPKFTKTMNSFLKN